MKITTYSIAKYDNDAYGAIALELEKLIGRFASYSHIPLMTKEIQRAQTVGANESQKAYSEALKNKGEGLRIALDPQGKFLTTENFSQMLDDANGKVTFYIGGAYGFEREFVKNCDKQIALSPLTMSHKLAYIVLAEQIYRGLTLLNNHPYHK